MANHRIYTLKVVLVILDYFISMVLLRIQTDVQPMTGIEGFKFQASDGK